jgi:hypothetical protein
VRVVRSGRFPPNQHPRSPILVLNPSDAKTYET